MYHICYIHYILFLLQFIAKFGTKYFVYISGLLRYKVDFQSMQCDDLDPNELYDIDDY